MLPQARKNKGCWCAAVADAAAADVDDVAVPLAARRASEIFQSIIAAGKENKYAAGAAVAAAATAAAAAVDVAVAVAAAGAADAVVAMLLLLLADRRAREPKL